MKIITIGRGEDCDIRFEDPNISRRHAVLRLHPGGKIEIVDYSANGTWVNGVRLGNEKLTRISRKDAVTFAGAASLDWRQVPDPGKGLRLAVIGCLALVLLCGLGVGAFVAVDALMDKKEQPAVTDDNGGKTGADSQKTTDGDKAGKDNADSDKAGDDDAQKGAYDDSDDAEAQKIMQEQTAKEAAARNAGTKKADKKTDKKTGDKKAGDKKADDKKESASDGDNGASKANDAEKTVTKPTKKRG